MSETNRVIHGIFWKFAERIMAQAVSLIVSIILARLLSPQEYGTIAIVTVFIAISNVFVNCGFGQALIQKKDADKKDFSSVFYVCLLVSAVLYVLLYFAATPIAEFYEIPELIPLTRVLGLTIPIQGFNSIQQAYVAKKMDFKKFFYATLIGTVISAFVGIFMAFAGYGVWALVAQNITNMIIDTVVLQISIDLKISLEFSIQRIRKLFSFGWKLLVQGFVLEIYSSLRSLLIGKFYTPEDLSFYNKGQQFPSLICTNIDTSISTALFPAMSNHQESIDEIRRMTKRTIRSVSYLMAPVLIGFIVTAEPFIEVVLTEKWLPCVPYLRIACIIMLFRAPQTALIQAAKALGRSDLVLKYDIPIRLFALFVLVVSLQKSVLIFAMSEILITVVGTFVYVYMIKPILNYGFIEVISDFIRYVIMACIMGTSIIVLNNLFHCTAILELIIDILTGIIVYIVLSILIKAPEFKMIRVILTNSFNGKRE